MIKSLVNRLYILNYEYLKIIVYDYFSLFGLFGKPVPTALTAWLEFPYLVLDRDINSMENREK